MIVNQWVPSAHYGDAIGDHILATRDLFRWLTLAVSLILLSFLFGEQVPRPE